MTMTGGERFGSIFEGGSAVGLGPAQLLRRFADRRDEAAFSALVAHHGPMVLATCRRILSNPADADDAFQATFLVLARKARAIEDPDRLAPWLHGVARRVAVRSRSLSARRRRVETEGQGVVAVAPPPDDARELRAVLDEELARLPEKYRVPLVLCYLEGMTHDEAAGQLDWPVGTVRSRMAQARDRLRSRLARRGFAPESVAPLFPQALPMAAVSRSLQALTVRFVLTSASKTAAPSVAALLAQGVLTSMFLNKVQAVAALAVATLSVAALGVAVGQPLSQIDAAAKPDAKSSPASKIPEDALDGSDDPRLHLAREKLDNATKDVVIAQLQVKMLELQLRLKAKEAAPQASTPPPPLNPPTPQNPSEKPAVTSQPQPEQPRKPWINALPSSAKILICPPEGNWATILETLNGVKKTYRDPGNVIRISPVVSQNMVALRLEGPKVTQVVAYCRGEDEWYPQELKEPALDGKIFPIVWPDVVQYRVGRYLYVFSNLGKRWGVLELKQPLPVGQHSMPGETANGECLMITEGDITHVYNYRSGDWTHINAMDNQ